MSLIGPIFWFEVEKPLSSWASIICFNLFGFLIRDGPSIKVLIASSGSLSTKVRLKSAGKTIPFEMLHTTPPTKGFGLKVFLVFAGPRQHRFNENASWCWAKKVRIRRDNTNPFPESSTKPPMSLSWMSRNAVVNAHYILVIT